MATHIVRKVPEEVSDALRIMAAKQRISVEELIRRILAEAAKGEVK